MAWLTPSELHPPAFIPLIIKRKENEYREIEEYFLDISSCIQCIHRERIHWINTALIELSPLFPSFLLRFDSQIEYSQIHSIRVLLSTLHHSCTLLCSFFGLISKCSSLINVIISCSDSWRNVEFSTSCNSIPFSFLFSPLPYRNQQ